LSTNGQAWLLLARQLTALPAPSEVQADVAAYIAAVGAAGRAAQDLAGYGAKNCGQKIADHNRTQAQLEQAHTDLVQAWVGQLRSRANLRECGHEPGAS
jgi:hypothetical protein